MSHTFFKYRTYDQLLAELQSDLKRIYLNDFMNPQEFIKVAKKCNAELGLRIFQTKQCVLDIEKGKAKLPNNFNVLNFALSLSSHCIIEPVISGTHVESINLGPIYNPGVWTDPNVCALPTVTPAVVNPPCDVPHPLACGDCSACGVKFESCSCKPVSPVTLNCDGNYNVLVQKFQFYTKTWKELHPIRIINSADVVDPDCPNRTYQSPNTAYLLNNFVYTSFKTGKLYINYQGMMEDDDGNLLVPDHDLLNEFYEYSIKARILENMIMNGEEVTQLQLQLTDSNLRKAKNNAYSYVNTPNFGELRRIWEVNRKAQYHNYFNMFKSY
jgi:hypothetical protein